MFRQRKLTIFSRIRAWWLHFWNPLNVNYFDVRVDRMMGSKKEEEKEEKGKGKEGEKEEKGKGKEGDKEEKGKGKEEKGKGKGKEKEKVSDNNSTRKLQADLLAGIEENVGQRLSDIEKLSTVESSTLAKDLLCDESLSSAIGKYLCRPDLRQMNDLLCRWLYTWYSSRQHSQQLYVLRHLPYLIWSYLTATPDSTSRAAFESCLLCIYNTEVKSNGSTVAVGVTKEFALSITQVNQDDVISVVMQKYNRHLSSFPVSSKAEMITVFEQVVSCGYHADRGATDALSEKGIEKESNTEDEADSYTKMVYREAEFHVPVRPLHVSSIMLMALVDLLTYTLGEKDVGLRIMSESCLHALQWRASADLLLDIMLCTRSLTH